MVMEAAQNRSLFASGYLSLKEDPSTWILNHYNLHFLVRILDLELPDIVKDIGDVIGALPNLTHLYFSLRNCSLYSHFDCLGKLYNLKSLDLCGGLPAALDLPFCLEHLTLRCYSYWSLPDSVAKLSNLKTLELYDFDEASLPENLNLTKLRLVNSYFKTLPTSLCHLEIVHSIGFLSCGDYTCDAYGGLKQLVNLKTLSLRCCRVKFLPSIAGQQILRTLLFKDCFNLRELMPNMDELVELCTLNISGTRIKSLPECITKLPKLQHLVLPKCFEQKNLPPQFLTNESIVKFEFDGMDDIYYKDKGYYSSCYESSTETSDKDNETSDEDTEITPESVVGLDDVVWRESGEEGMINVQTSSCRLPNPPEATQGLGDLHISGPNFSTGENSHHASCCSQSQETENLSSGVHSMAIVEDMITELSSNFQETNNFSEDRQVGTMNLGNKESIITSSDQLISSSGVRSFVHDENSHQAVVDAQNCNNSHGADKKGNGQRKEITREEIQSLRDEHMTLIEAGKKLGVSRSTMKRRCRELELDKWPSSRKKKINCSEKRKINTKSPSGGGLSQPNLVECTNPAGPEYDNECLDVNQHNLSEQVAAQCDFIDNSTPSATTENVGELNMATRRHMDAHESVPESTVGADVHTLLGTVQGSSSSSSFEIKATHKTGIVRFKWSSTACLKELKEAVAENLKIEFDSFKLEYMDEEKDWVLINTNEHLKRAVSLIEDDIFRLKVTDL